MKKVLVRSTMREVVAKVGEYPTRNHQGTAVMAPLTRQFREWCCYMTPEEAEFLVESNENRRMRAAGRADYYYPAGFPAPVDENYEGPLAPAVNTDNLMTGDPSQALAAKEQLERAATALAAQEKGANSPMMQALSKQPAAP